MGTSFGKKIPSVTLKPTRKLHQSKESQVATSGQLVEKYHSCNSSVVLEQTQEEQSLKLFKVEPCPWHKDHKKSQKTKHMHIKWANLPFPK